MKCSKCWAEKAYLRQETGYKKILFTVFLLAPLRCHHCYHKFSVPWLFALGKPLRPAKGARKAVPRTAA